MLSKIEPAEASEQMKALTERVSRSIAEEVNSLQRLWAELRPYQRVAIVHEATVYLSPVPDPAFFDPRERREQQLVPAIKREIANLRRASVLRKEFEGTCASLFGEKVALTPAPSNGVPSLSFALEIEVVRLSILYEKARDAYNKKRLGTKRSLHPLILMEEYIAHLSDSHGASRRITALQIADLLRFVALANGDDQANDSDPEKLRKALSHFRSNPLNQDFVVTAKIWTSEAILLGSYGSVRGDKS